MMRLVTLVMLLAVLCLPMSASAAEWPRFLGPNGDGISPETGINKNWAQRPPKVLWRTPMSDKGFAGPAVADGVLYIIDHTGHKDIVRAIDVQTGKDLWQFTYEDTSRENYGFARSTPLVSEGKVYTLSRLGLVHCLDPKSGRVLWQRDIIKDFKGKRPDWDLAGSPVLDGEKLILVAGGRDATVVALNKDTGQTIWTGGGTHEPGYATPVVATIGGTKQYVVFTAKHLIGVDAATGALLWKFPWETRYNVNAATPIVSGDTIFITSSYQTGCALLQLTKRGVRQVWRSKDVQSHFSTGLLVDGFLYSTSDPGRLVCLELSSGKVAWARRGFEKGGLVGVDGTAIVCDGKTGDVVMVQLSPTRYQELGRIKPLGGQSWTAPVVAEGKLFIRNREALVCLDLE